MDTQVVDPYGRLLGQLAANEALFPDDPGELDPHETYRAFFAGCLAGE